MTAVTALGSGVIPVSPGRTRYTVDKPSIVVDVRRGKGKDLRQAARLVDEPTPLAAQFALISLKMQVNGKDLAFEDLDEMDEDEVHVLLEILRGERLSDDEKAKAAEEAAKKQGPKGELAEGQEQSDANTSASPTST